MEKIHELLACGLSPNTVQQTVNSEIFARNFIFVKSVKKHIYDVENLQLRHASPISVNDRVIFPFRENFGKNKTLEKISEFTVLLNFFTVFTIMSL